MISLSLIIPCYNEEVNLQKGVLDKIGNYVEKREEFKEVLIIDDGSNDKSKEIIKRKYLALFPKFKLIENKHKGKANAVLVGILKASNSYVMFSDIDLATPIEESEKLINAADQGFKIIIGSRQSKRIGAPILRKIMAIGAIVVRDLIIGLHGIKDTQCGFKLFQKKAAEKIINKLIVYKQRNLIEGSSVSAGFDIEFLFIARKLGYEIKEIPVTWKHVETKNVHFLNDSIEALKDIFKIKYLDFKGQYNK
jgi:glycosyltransferase involved in cell wall biosynthesis